MRKRAELLAHVQHTNSQYNLPEIGKKIAYKANRDLGWPSGLPIPPCQKSVEVDLALIDYYDQLLETSSEPFSRRRSNMMPTPCTCSSLSRASAKFCVWCCSMRFMTSPASRGSKISSPIVASFNVPRNQRANAPAPPVRRSAMPLSRGPFPKRPSCFSATIRRARKYLARLENKHGKGKALTILAHTAGPGGL